MKSKRDDRRAKIMELRERGKSLRAIGEIFGISTERVRQITKTKTEEKEMLFDGRLSKRVYHPLMRAGIKTKEQLELALVNGLCVCNIGEKACAEISDYLGESVAIVGKRTMPFFTSEGYHLFDYERRVLQYERKREETSVAD